jgi:hypothetical protein
LHEFELDGDEPAVIRRPTSPLAVLPMPLRSEPVSGVSVILGNYVAGRFAEYRKWYDEMHSVEATNVPGHVAMKRGELSPIQIEPRRSCPGDRLALCAQWTDDRALAIGDFSARARGKSPSGMPRGIGYAGDLSVYSDKRRAHRNGAPPQARTGPLPSIARTM